MLQDLRFAVRSFLRAPRFTIPAVLALALGIGSTSASHSVVLIVVLTPQPFRAPDRIVSVWEHNPKLDRAQNAFGAANFMSLRVCNRQSVHIAKVVPARLN